MRDAGYMPDVIHGAEQGSEEERYQLIRSIISALQHNVQLPFSATRRGCADFWSAALEVGLRVPQDLSLIASVSRPNISWQGKRLSRSAVAVRGRSVPVPCVCCCKKSKSRSAAYLLRPLLSRHRRVTHTLSLLDSILKQQKCPIQRAVVVFCNARRRVRKQILS
jgi:hypothetical protein